MNYKVIDNFLIEPLFQNILQYFTHSNMPWYFKDSVVYGDDKEKNDKNAYQFTNTLYNFDLPSSQGIEPIRPLLNELQIFSLIRVKANLNTVREKSYISAMHHDNADFSSNNLRYTVGIYHLTDNNGRTELKIGKDIVKIESKANIMILLSGDTLHRGCSSTDNTRLLLNLNFINKDTNKLYDDWNKDRTI